MSAARAADARHASAVVKSLVGILGTPRLIKRPSTLAKREPDKEYQNIDVVGEDLCGMFSLDIEGLAHISITNI